MLIAVDTGGTKTLIASFSEEGVAGEQFRYPTPHKPEEYIATLRNFLVEHYGGQTIEAVVVAIPGIIKDGVAIWCNNLQWKNFHVADALEGVLGDAPIIIENDANLAGLAETRSLKEIPALSLYVTVSTGIGTGITTNGTINAALRYSEGGRMLTEFDGAMREWETFASGNAIYHKYGKYARDITSKRTWNQIADRISRGFLAVIPMLQPDIIIIGGSMGTYFAKYELQLKEILRTHLPDHIPEPKIVSAQHPEEAVIYGCYYYALDYFADK